MFGENVYSLGTGHYNLTISTTQQETTTVLYHQITCHITSLNHGRN